MNMKIAITSQNFRTITGHAGKTRRFLIYSQDTSGKATETGRIDLPSGMSLHDYAGPDHPLYEFDVVITGGCGEGFIQRMQAQGVQVMATSETDPLAAASAILAGDNLPPPLPHDHHDDHGAAIMP